MQDSSGSHTASVFKDSHSLTITLSPRGISRTSAEPLCTACNCGSLSVKRTICGCFHYSTENSLKLQLLDLPQKPSAEDGRHAPRSLFVPPPSAAGTRHHRACTVLVSRARLVWHIQCVLMNPIVSTFDAESGATDHGRFAIRKQLIEEALTLDGDLGVPAAGRQHLQCLGGLPHAHRQPRGWVHTHTVWTEHTV